MVQSAWASDGPLSRSVQSRCAAPTGRQPVASDDRCSHRHREGAGHRGQRLSKVEDDRARRSRVAQPARQLIKPGGPIEGELGEDGVEAGEVALHHALRDARLRGHGSARQSGASALAWGTPRDQGEGPDDDTGLKPTGAPSAFREPTRCPRVLPSLSGWEAVASLWQRARWSASTRPICPRRKRRSPAPLQVLQPNDVGEPGFGARGAEARVDLEAVRGELVDTPT